MRKFWLVSIFSLLPIYSSFADDTAFGGEGAAPMPIKHEDVRMVSENVIINGHDIDRSDWKGHWEYSCDYVFKNESNNHLSFKMGFPLPINHETGEITTPAHYSTKKGGALVYDFILTVNGKGETATKSKITPIPDKDLYYEDAYLWNMTMLPQQTINIQHHYISGVTINVMGQNDVSFVLKTGGLWKDGVIQSAKLTVVPNTTTRLCSEVDRTAESIKPQPQGMQIMGDNKNRKYVWDLKNFKPTEDLSLCLVSGKNYVHYYIVNPLILSSEYQGKPVKNLTEKDLRILRNSIYAQYGKHFNDTDLQVYFDKQWWYKANSNYTDQMLTEEDKKAINLILKQQR